MTENMQLLIVIVLVLVTNLITYVVTWHYYTAKVNALLRERAVENTSRDQELINARIISKTYGDMRATALAYMEANDAEG